jgi:hypothetical protein
MSQRRRRLVVDRPPATRPPHGRLVPLKLRPSAGRVVSPTLALPQPTAAQRARAGGAGGGPEGKVHQKAVPIVPLGGVAESRGVVEGRDEEPGWEHTFAVGEHAAAVFVNVEKI